MGCSLRNPGTSSAHIDVDQIFCVLDNVFMITLIKHSNTVAKEIMQIRSQTCCSVTIDNKSHVVAPAVSTDDFPVVRRLSPEEQQALDLLRKHEKQPEPQCLVCTMNLALLILENDRLFLFEEKCTQTTLAALHVKKVRDEDDVQSAEFFVNLALVFKLTNWSGSIQC